MEAIRLADDPRVYPSAVFDLDLGPCETLSQLDAVAVAVVGLPVGLELDRRRDDDSARKGPVEVIRVQSVDDVTDPNRLAAWDAGQQDHDAKLGERIASVCERRRLKAWIGQCQGVSEQHGSHAITSIGTVL